MRPEAEKNVVVAVSLIACQFLWAASDRAGEAKRAE